MSGELSAFIARLRRAAHAGRAVAALPAQIEETVRQSEKREGLAAVFSERAGKAGALLTTACEADWADHVARLAGAAGRRVVLSPATLPARLAHSGEPLAEHLRASGLSVGDSRDRETLFGADVSITGVAAAIAETGSIVWHAASDAARGATLIAPVHVAVVGLEQVVPDLHDYFEQLGAGAFAAPRASGAPGGALPAHLNIITGPSKTADIEGVLVTGVHGPGRVHIVLVR